ncbi:hypothetical protein CHS0354_033062 [Potamilus streckersoni]|uniref:Uncharacterized protein n=1 Tax=Potamilus streckersoni TaxID=2493646 RepID=A0AAE0SQ99_9BIVA|nr:hypothetical protein CHS0354_033062 [Potamilus streckersoni]
MVMMCGRTLMTLMISAMILICMLEPSHGKGCISIGWGGCADGGCGRLRGHCINHGHPPINRCECLRIG